MSVQVFTNQNQNQNQNQPINLTITDQEIKSIQDEIICGKEIKFNYLNVDKLINLLYTKNISKDNLNYMDILKYNYKYRTW